MKKYTPRRCYPKKRFRKNKLNRLYAQIADAMAKEIRREIDKEIVEKILKGMEEDAIKLV
jgi:hypothetical protein